MVCVYNQVVCFRECPEETATAIFLLFHHSADELGLRRKVGAEDRHAAGQGEQIGNADGAAPVLGCEGAAFGVGIEEVFRWEDA